MPVEKGKWNTIMLDNQLCALTFDFFLPFILFSILWSIILFFKYWFDLRQKAGKHKEQANEKEKRK